MSNEENFFFLQLRLYDASPEFVSIAKLFAFSLYVILNESFAWESKPTSTSTLQHQAQPPPPKCVFVCLVCLYIHTQYICVCMVVRRICSVRQRWNDDAHEYGGISTSKQSNIPTSLLLTDKKRPAVRVYEWYNPHDFSILCFSYVCLHMNSPQNAFSSSNLFM